MESMTQVILKIKDDLHSGLTDISKHMVEMRVQMQRNTDSLIHHEERTSLLHEEVNLLKEAVKLLNESNQQLQTLVEKNTEKQETKKQTKKEIWAFWGGVFASLAQLATVGSFIAYVLMN